MIILEKYVLFCTIIRIITKEDLSATEGIVGKEANLIYMMEPMPYDGLLTKRM